MTSAVDIINVINYIISGYVNYFIVIAGLFGNITNTLVFSQLRLFRGNQSAFYLTLAPIISCCQLIFSTFIRATATVFSYDLTQTSLVWCKLRMYLIQVGATISAIIVCFAAIDQYLSTSHHARLRQISTFKLARLLSGIVIIIAALYSIPVAIFQEIRSSSGCATYNPAFNYYYSFVHLCIVIGIVPIVIASLFSFLAYRHVRRIVRRQLPIVRRRLDQQLTAMILVRVALFVITTLPFVSSRVYQIYRSINQNDTYAVAVDQFIRTTFTAIYQINFAGSFYVFLASSSRFRRQVKYLFSKKIRQLCSVNRVNRNQIATETQRQTNVPHVHSVEID